MATTRSSNPRTKAELQAELDQANDLNAALLELVDAINDAASAAPVAAAGPGTERKELRRARDMLSSIKSMTDRRDKIKVPGYDTRYEVTPRSIRGYAEILLKSVAEPLGYEPYKSAE
jgi:hypothetical protein